MDLTMRKLINILGQRTGIWSICIWTFSAKNSCLHYFVVPMQSFCHTKLAQGPESWIFYSRSTNGGITFGPVMNLSNNTIIWNSFVSTTHCYASISPHQVKRSLVTSPVSIVVTAFLLLCEYLVFDFDLSRKMYPNITLMSRRKPQESSVHQLCHSSFQLPVRHG